MFEQLVGMTVEEVVAVLEGWGEEYDFFLADDEETVLSVMVEGVDLFVTDGVVDYVAYAED